MIQSSRPIYTASATPIRQNIGFGEQAPSAQADIPQAAVVEKRPGDVIKSQKMRYYAGQFTVGAVISMANDVIINGINKFTKHPENYISLPKIARNAVVWGALFIPLDYAFEKIIDSFSGDLNKTRAKKGF